MIFELDPGLMDDWHDWQCGIGEAWKEGLVARVELVLPLLWARDCVRAQHRAGAEVRLQENDARFLSEGLLCAGCLGLRAKQNRRADYGMVLERCMARLRSGPVGGLISDDRSF